MIRNDANNSDGLVCELKHDIYTLSILFGTIHDNEDESINEQML